MAYISTQSSIPARRAFFFSHAPGKPRETSSCSRKHSKRWTLLGEPGTKPKMAVNLIQGLYIIQHKTFPVPDSSRYQPIFSFPGGWPKKRVQHRWHRFVDK